MDDAVEPVDVLAHLVGEAGERGDEERLVLGAAGTRLCAIEVRGRRDHPEALEPGDRRARGVHLAVEAVRRGVVADPPADAGGKAGRRARRSRAG